MKYRRFTFILLLLLIVGTILSEPSLALYDEKECVLSMDMEQIYVLPKGGGLGSYQNSYVFDVSPYRNNGELLPYGDDTPANQTDYSGPLKTFGYYGYALEFDGVDDYVSVPDDVSLNITEEITVMCWFKVNTWPVLYSHLVGKGDILNPYILYISNDTNTYNLRFFITNNTGGYVSPGYDITDSLDTWIHATGTYDGSTVTLYVNGVAEITSSLSGPIKLNDNPVYIGADDQDDNGSADYFFDGSIDDLRVYDFELSSDEIFGDCYTPINQYYEQNILYYYNKTEGWTLDPVTGKHGHYQGDPWCPWVNRAGPSGATGDDVQTHYWKFVPGFQQMRFRGTFLNNITQNGGSQQGHTWFFYFFKDGLWVSYYKVDIYRGILGTGDDHQWYINIGYKPRELAFSHIPQVVVNTTQAGDDDEWNWCVDGFTSQDGKQFVIRVTSENSTYAWDLGYGEGWETDRYHVERRWDLVDENRVSQPLDYFDSFCAIDFRSQAKWEVGTVAILRHKTGIIGNFLKRIYDIARRGFEMFVTPVVKMVTGVELPSLPPPEIITSGLEAWKQAIMDFAPKLSEGFGFITSGIQMAFAPLTQAVNNLLGALGLGQLNIWTIFVSFIDTIAASTFGIPNMFSNFLSWVQTLFTNAVNSLGYIISLIAQTFIMLAEGMGHVVQLITHMATYWVRMFQTFKDILGDYAGQGINVWTGLIAPFVPFLVILYPLYIFFIWADHGTDAAYKHLQRLMDVGSFLLHLFINFAQLVISLVSGFIEAIPIVE